MNYSSNYKMIEPVLDDKSTLGMRLFVNADDDGGVGVAMIVDEDGVFVKSNGVERFNHLKLVLCQGQGGEVECGLLWLLLLHRRLQVKVGLLACPAWGGGLGRRCDFCAVGA